jgi:hypothetical protein
MRSRGKRLRLNRLAKSQGHAFLEYGVFERYEYASRRLALCKNVTSGEVQICVSSNHNDEGPNRAFWTTMPILRRSSLGKFYPPGLIGAKTLTARRPSRRLRPTATSSRSCISLSSGRLSANRLSARCREGRRPSPWPLGHARCLTTTKAEITLFLRDFDAEIEASRTVTATLSSGNPVRRLGITCLFEISRQAVDLEAAVGIPLLCHHDQPLGSVADVWISQGRRTASDAEIRRDDCRSGCVSTGSARRAHWHLDWQSHSDVAGD